MLKGHKGPRRSARPMIFLLGFRMVRSDGRIHSVGRFRIGGGAYFVWALPPNTGGTAQRHGDRNPFVSTENLSLPYEVQTDGTQRTIRYEGLFQKRMSYTISTGVLNNEQRNSPRLVEMYLEGSEQITPFCTKTPWARANLTLIVVLSFLARCAGNTAALAFCPANGRILLANLGY
jgi:hypothetical protein